MHWEGVVWCDGVKFTLTLSGARRDCCESGCCGTGNLSHIILCCCCCCWHRPVRWWWGPGCRVAETLSPGPGTPKVTLFCIRIIDGHVVSISGQSFDTVLVSASGTTSVLCLKKLTRTLALIQNVTFWHSWWSQSYTALDPIHFFAHARTHT